jgi:hypothetical protein
MYKKYVGMKGEKRKRRRIGWDLEGKREENEEIGRNL